MGLTPGTAIFLRKTAPLGDPIQLSLRGYELTIRKADAARIGVSPLGSRGTVPALPLEGSKYYLVIFAIICYAVQNLLSV
jgi:hypothetical protein